MKRQGKIDKVRPAIERLWWIAAMLRDRREIRATVVARRFEVSTKTAHRDLEFLRDRLRYEIEFDYLSRSYVLRKAPVAVL